MSLLQSFSLNDYLLFVIGLITVLPTIKLYQLYKRTHLKDFLFFSGFYAFYLIQVWLFPIANYVQTSLILYNIAALAQRIGMFFLFLHILYIRYESVKKVPKTIWYFGVSWVLIDSVLVLLREITVAPEVAHTYFGWKWKGTTVAGEDGAYLISSKGWVLSGVGFNILLHFFQLFCWCLAIYYYRSYDFSGKSTLTTKAKSIWIIVFTLLALAITYRILGGYQIIIYSSELYNIFILMQSLLILFLVIRHPEVLLITKVQITRAANLYRLIKESETPISSQVIKIDEYLQKLILEGLVN